jgi:hypothetical protein
MFGAGDHVHPFRQALYLDGTGIVAAKSVTAAAGGYSYDKGVLRGANVHSVGENFNGIVVAGGTQTIQGASLDLRGNGGNDFAGFGAGLLAIGKGTTLIVDGARIQTRGAIRTAAVADKSSRLIVKNSVFAVRDGVLPAGYQSNVTPGEMKDAPWMLGIRGNARATNLLGEGTMATYINSDVSSENWGVLSVDNGKNTRLTAINSKVSTVGANGYGSYAIGDSTNAFYGTDINVKDYAQIITGGDVIYAASSAENVNRLNTELKLGLSAAELKSLTPKQTSVHSARFGVMWHGKGSVTVRDATRIDTGKTIFLVKGASARIDVDGAGGAALHAGNGVLVQVIDNDDPGPSNVKGFMINNGVYHEPTAPATRAADFDPGAAHDTDVTVRFANLKLAGSLYNGVHSGPRPPFGEGGPGVKSPAGENLAVTLEHVQLAGVISSATARHAQATITAADYLLLGDVTNTASAAVRNGVQLTLRSSTWTVTGKSYLSSLNYDAASSLAAAPGRKLTLSVDGKATALAPGRYTGTLIVDVQ